jgi:DNA-binding NarL/FixJ family response regulator
MRRRVLIAHPDAPLLAALARLVAGCPGAELVGQVSDAGRLVETAALTKPDVVVLGMSVHQGEMFDAVRRLRLACPTCYLIATADWPHGPFLALARSAGVDEVIGHLDCADRLRAALSADPPADPPPAPPPL